MGRMNLLSSVVNSQSNQVEGYCLVRSVAQKSNVKGSDYLDFVLSDAGGEVVAKLWDFNPEQHGSYYPDNLVKVRGTVNIWKETEQLKIDRIRLTKEGDDVDMSAFVPTAPIPGTVLYDEIYACAEKFKNEDIRMLTQYILRENKEKLVKYPAALKLHHAMRGGLLYHTRTMLQTARAICDVYEPIYPSLSRDLVYAGIILHDVAKVEELTVSELGLASGYSMPGQLLGHIPMGVGMLVRAAAELMVDEKHAILLEHILLAHHDTPEHGSPKPPMFPEAEIVSQIDLLDSRLYEMYDALSSVTEGEFSERQWALDNRQLYKHGLE